MPTEALGIKGGVKEEPLDLFTWLCQTSQLHVKEFFLLLKVIILHITFQTKTPNQGSKQTPLCSPQGPGPGFRGTAPLRVRAGINLHPQ